MTDETQTEKGEFELNPTDTRTRLLYEQYENRDAHFEFDAPGVNIHVDLDQEAIKALGGPGLNAAAQVFGLLGPVFSQVMQSQPLQPLQPLQPYAEEENASGDEFPEETIG